MVEATDNASEFHELLQQFNRGDNQALDRLIHQSCRRLENLTSHMLRGYPALRRWVETGDVLQNSLVRLLRALEQVQPDSARHFLSLATLQIRRELVDLARHYFGPAGLAANQQSRGGGDSERRQAEELADLSHEPSTLAQWCELHEQLTSLPEKEREVVELLFYHGISQTDAAEVLGISVRTVQRHWHSALAILHRTLRGQWPGL